MWSGVVVTGLNDNSYVTSMFQSECIDRMNPQNTLETKYQN